MIVAINYISNYLLGKKRFVEIFFVIFYVVGFAGLAIPSSHQIFLKLFPVALLLSLTAIFLFHQTAFNYSKTIGVFVLIGISGFLIEVAGVNTHVIFGNYIYGDSLGIKLFSTPLLIGLNWVMLSYAGSSLTERMPLAGHYKVVVAAVLMLIYDLILEQIAPVLDMWYWEGGSVPVRNYIAWFVIAVVFQSLIRVSKIETRNQIVVKIILIQLVFFIALILFFKF